MNKEVYTSTISRVPFSIPLLDVMPDKKQRFWAKKLLNKSEKQVNLLFAGLEKTGLLNYIDYSDVKTNDDFPNNYYIEFRLKKDVSAFPKEDKVSPLFSYNITRSKVMLSHVLYKKIGEYFLAKKGERDLFENLNNSRSGVDAKTFIEILLFDRAKVNSSIFGNRNLLSITDYIKIIAVQAYGDRLSAKNEFNTMNSLYHKVILGEPKDWYRYFLVGLKSDAVAYFFTHSVYESVGQGYAKAVDNYASKWNRMACYSPEELSKAAGLPLEWVMSVYPNKYLIG